MHDLDSITYKRFRLMGVQAVHYQVPLAGTRVSGNRLFDMLDYNLIQCECCPHCPELEGVLEVLANVGVGTEKPMLQT